jgi:hypothetical protein
MASVDPRLADLTVLVLAAKRRLAARHVPDWQQTEGLSALLAAARALPQRDPWALPDLEESSGLARLVKEARQWHEEGRHGA